MSSADAAISEASVKKLVEEYVDSKLEDRKVVEYEVAEAVAARLIGWAKIFGVCLAVPLAILVAILAVHGINGFGDFDATLERFKKENIAELEKKNRVLMTAADASAARIQARMASQIAQIEGISKDQIGPTVAQTRQLRADVDQMVSEYKALRARLADATKEAAESGKRVAEKLERIESALSLDQINRVRAMINIFEFGAANPDYARSVVVGPEGVQFAGEAGKKLAELLNDYRSRPNARFGAELGKYLPRPVAKESAAQNDGELASLLKRAAADPEMVNSINDMFSKWSFVPAVQEAKSLGIRSALGIATVLDSRVHGGWASLRDRTTSKLGGTPITGISERTWIREYLTIRREWLANHARQDLRAVASRPQALLSLADKNNWELVPPIIIQGHSTDDSR